MNATIAELSISQQGCLKVAKRVPTVSPNSSVTAAACSDCGSLLNGTGVRCFDCAARLATEWGIRNRGSIQRRLADGDKGKKKKGQHA